MRRLIALTSLAAMLMAAAGPRAGAQAGLDPFQLKTAGPNNYAVLSTSNSTSTSVQFSHPQDGILGPNNPASGDLGVLAAKVQNADNTITGKVYLGSNATYQQSGAASNGGIVQPADAQLTQAAADAAAASAYNAGLAATPVSVNGVTETLNGVNFSPSGNETIVGGTGVNVLNLTGVNIGNGDVITLEAPIGGQFVINDSGGFQLNGGGGQGFDFFQPNASGVYGPSGNADSVLYNITGTQAVAFTGGGNASKVTGILLAPNANIALTPGQVTGEIIGGGNLNFSSGSNVINPVPELSTCVLSGLLLLCLGGILLRARKAPGTVSPA